MQWARGVGGLEGPYRDSGGRPCPSPFSNSNPPGWNPISPAATPSRHLSLANGRRCSPTSPPEYLLDGRVGCNGGSDSGTSWSCWGEGASPCLPSQRLLPTRPPWLPPLLLTHRTHLPPPLNTANGGSTDVSAGSERPEGGSTVGCVGLKQSSQGFLSDAVVPCRATPALLWMPLAAAAGGDTVARHRSER